MKKSITILLIIALSLALAIPAFASTFNPNSLPNRRLTDAELQTWIENYYATGGATEGELAAIAELNRIRRQEGLVELQIDEQMMLAGRFHSQTIAQLNNGQISHEAGPYGGSRNVARTFGFMSAGGNGAWENAGVRAITAWMNSPGHRQAMLRPNLRYVGIGNHPSGGSYMFFTQNPSNNPYPYLTASAWARSGIDSAVRLNLVPSHLQNNYRNITTRAEFCALAVMLYESVTGRTITERSTFTDTNDINVQKMAGIGVVTGVGNNQFSPNSLLTREQAATMISRLANAIGQPFTSSRSTFADNSLISSWAFDAVGEMQGSGIMGGVGNNRFDPRGNYERQQAIITMLRLYEHLGGDMTLRPVSVPPEPSWVAIWQAEETGEPIIVFHEKWWQWNLADRKWELLGGAW